MAILLGLAAALLFGGSDFTGGFASRRAASLAVNLTGAIAATVVVWAALGLSGGPPPSVHAAVWGLAGGVGGAVGLIVLYRGLARGQMSVVGPLSAVGAAVVPVLAGVALGDRPGLWGAVGVLVALPAIGLVAANGSGVRGASRTAPTDGLVAGLGFGLNFVSLAQAGGGDGLWPVAVQQSTVLVIVLVVALATRAPLSPSVRAAGLPMLAGIGNMAGMLLYFYATQSGLLSTVAILTSLYPGVTVLLARTITGERLAATQRIGLGLCGLAVVAIALN